jgi:hypothetical protein
MTDSAFANYVKGQGAAKQNALSKQACSAFRCSNLRRKTPLALPNWQAGKLADQPSLANTLRLHFLSPEELEFYNQQLRSILDRLYWRVLSLEKELDAMKKERGHASHGSY